MPSEDQHDFKYMENGVVNAYENLYGRIFWELDCAGKELSGKCIEFSNLEHAAMHLRLCIEEVAMASLVANYKIFEEFERSVESLKDYGEVRKALEGMNPKYWPVAFGMRTLNGITGLGVLPNVGLQQDDVPKNWGITSELLHAYNPFKGTKREPDDYLDFLLGLHSELNALLVSHLVQLVPRDQNSGPGEYIWLRRDDDGNNGVRSQVFKTNRQLY